MRCKSVTKPCNKGCNNHVTTLLQPLDTIQKQAVTTLLQPCNRYEK